MDANGLPLQYPYASSSLCEPSAPPSNDRQASPDDGSNLLEQSFQQMFSGAYGPPVPAWMAAPQTSLPPWTAPSVASPAAWQPWPAAPSGSETPLPADAAHDARYPAPLPLLAHAMCADELAVLQPSAPDAAPLSIAEATPGGLTPQHAPLPWAPPSRLQAEVTTGQAVHKKPVMVSVPAGFLNVKAGARLLRCHDVRVHLRCTNFADATAPCHLIYSGRTEQGALLGGGAGAFHVSVAGYAGASFGRAFAYERVVSDFATRQKLHQACQHHDTEFLQAWLTVPDPGAIDDFAVGDMWEQSSLRRFSNGAILGCAVQSLDVGVDLEGHFILRCEKRAPDTVMCTVIPVRFRRLFAGASKVLEGVSHEREHTRGSSVTYQFRLSAPKGRAAYEAFVKGRLPTENTLQDPQTSAAVALLRRETVTQSTVRHSVHLLRGRIGAFTERREGVQQIEQADGCQTLESVGQRSGTRFFRDRTALDVRVTARYVQESQHDRHRRAFDGMLLEVTLDLEHGKGAEASHTLAKERTKQLAFLSHRLGVQLPSYHLPAVPGHLRLQAVCTLDAACVDHLANLPRQQVERAARGCNADDDEVAAAVNAFADLAALEEKSTQQKALLGANAAEIDRDATARQAERLQKALRKPHLLEVVTHYLAEQDLLPTVAMSIECEAYDEADAAVANLPWLQNPLPEGVAQTEQLARYFHDVQQASVCLRRARRIAEADPLSAAYEADSLRDRCESWDAALATLWEVEQPAALQAHPKRAALAWQEKSVFARISLPQRVGLLAERFPEHGASRADKARLDALLEDLEDEMKCLCQEKLSESHLEVLLEQRLTAFRSLVHLLETNRGVARKGHDRLGKLKKL